VNTQTESRGWETESNYHEHFLDDPDVDITSYAESNAGAFVASLAALVILFVGIHFLRDWTKPPVLVFPTATAPEVIPIPEIFNAHWKVSCLYINGGTKVIRPNYDNPVCTADAAKKRGDL
jgi:hypothetical protein